MWTARLLLTTSPPDVTTLTALEYCGHAPYGNGGHKDFHKFYGDTESDIGGGLFGYFPAELCEDIQHRLNFIFPADDGDWRWQTVDGCEMEEPMYQEQFTKSLAEGVSGIYDPAGILRGYMLGKGNSPAIYAVLAVLQQGPAPTGTE